MSEAVLLGLLFADKIIVENNGKKGIIGMFTTFHSQNFPVVFPPWAIFASFTNVNPGTHTITLNLVHEETSQVILPISSEIPVKSREEVIDIVPTIMGAVFPKAGKYNLTLNLDGEQIGSRVLTIEQRPQGPQGQQ